MHFKGVVGEVSCRYGVVMWRVEKFSSLSQSVDCFYNSPEFHFQDRRWYLQLCPNGQICKNSKGCVGLYLFLENSCTPIELRYLLGIQAADGSNQVSFKSIITFGEESLGWGVPSLIPRSELLRQSEQLLPQDVFTLAAMLQVGGADVEGTKEVSLQTEDNAGNAEVQEKSGGEKGVLHDIKKLWLSGENSDVVLKVQDVEFKAHRNILAVRTPVLGAMFQHDTAEAASGEVTIDDCEPAIFEQLLHFIYTGAPRVLNAENAVALYVVADKYLVSDVKALCVRCMKEELCLDTFCDYAELSLVYKEAELLEMVIDFFSRNMIHVIKTVEWQRFLNEHSTWGNEILIRAAELTEPRNGENTS